MELLERIDRYLELRRNEIVEKVCELVRIPSVAEEPQGEFPYGVQCAKALDFCSDLCVEKGLFVTAFDYHCLEAKISSRAQGRRLVLAAHADVVPPSPGNLYPPYGGVVNKGYIIGRGVVDNKAPLIAALYALAFFCENNIPLNNDMRLVVGCCEEYGMGDLRHYLERAGQPDWGLAVDDDFPVCNGEGGEGGYLLPEDDKMVVLLTDLYNRVSGTDYRPYVMHAKTYARLFTHGCGFGAGTPNEVKPFPPGHGSAHGPDEAHSVQVLLHAVKMYILGILAVDEYWGELPATVTSP